METLHSEQVRKLREHQAIPRGGWKLVAGICNHLLLVFCAYGLGRLVTTLLEGVTTESWAYLTGGGVMALTFMALNLVLFLRQVAWLRQYWYKNILGNVAWFSLYEVEEFGKTHVMLHHMICSRVDSEEHRRLRYTPSDARHNVAIQLPLGGWFAQPGITYGYEGEIGLGSRLSGWSVSLRTILDAGAVMVKVRKHNHSCGLDEQFVCAIGSAIEYLEEIAMDRFSPSSISEFVRRKMDGLATATRERDEARRDLKAECEAHEKTREGSDELFDGRLEAIQTVRRITEKMESMTRLPENIEGLELLYFCLEWLTTGDRQGALLPESLEQLQEKFAAVHRKLGEKRVRAKRRHGRKPAAPAPAPAA